MSEAIRWWAVMQVVSLAVLPLCLAMFSRLPDRGYSLSKPFALLFLGFGFWFLNSIGLLPNSRGGIIATLLVLTLIAGAFACQNRDELRTLASRHWRYVIAVELMLLVTFMVAVWLRHLVGQIQGTEQPMDLMFINAATVAERFPPQDPWLAGYDVAYYYFGYLIVAMIGKMAGVPTEVAYNLGLGMIASLTFVGAFGLVYNLVQAQEEGDAPPRAEEAMTVLTPASAPVNWRPPIFGIAAALMLVVMGNLAFVLHFASCNGIGNRGFYEWIDVSGLTADETCETWYPSQFFSFFDASRIYLLDTELQFRGITEFPMFSVLLGDLHPHVMALPFVLLAAGVALALFRSVEPLDLTYWLRRPLQLVAVAVMLGALAFINTWDIATMAFVVVLAVLAANFLQMRASPPRPVAADGGATAGAAKAALTQDEQLFLGIAAVVYAVGLAAMLITLDLSPLMRLLLVAGSVVLFGLFALYLSRDDWSFPVELTARTVTFAVPLLLLAVDLYIPFFMSFESQASGIGASVTRPGVEFAGTRPVWAFLFWGPLFVVVVPYVGARLLAAKERITRRAVLVASMLPAAVILGWGVLFLWQQALDSPKLAGAGGLATQIGDRGSEWLTALVFAAVLAGSVLALWLEATAPKDEGGREGNVFVLLLASTAFLLVLGCEFFYVGDLFNSRMNTVFKLYYQAWLLLALAGGFALYRLAGALHATEGAKQERRLYLGWAGAVAIVLAGAALYPLGGTFNRTRPYSEDGNLITSTNSLNGLNHFSEGERAAIDWLKKRAQGQDIVIAEAVGNDYTEAARISAATGAPAILGWGGHEDQWRGSSAPRAGRFEDVNALYSGEISRLREIVEKYDVTYIVVGDLERRTYGEPALQRFVEMPVAFQSGTVTIYSTAGLEDEVTAAP